MQLEIEHSKLVIGYYPFRAKAQILRLLCQYLQIPYQDRFFTPDQWTKFKETQAKKNIFKDMPFIIHEGFMICGTYAPARYIIELSNKYQLLGKTEKDRIRIDEFKNKVDMKDAIISLIINNRTNGLNAQKLKCINQQIEKRIQPTILQFQAECFPDNFFFGYLTVFDFVIYEIINHFKCIYPNLLIKVPKLARLRDRVAEIPQIKAYETSSRAVTEICPIRFFNKFKEQKINACKGMGLMTSSTSSCNGMDLE